MAGITAVYAREHAPEEYTASIFLVGPTPTVNGAHSWRVAALRLLEEAGFEGVVFIPESRPDEHGNTRFRADYTDQVEWEWLHIQLADVILAWVPRSLEHPGITTNYELGENMDSGKMVFGAPPDSWKTRYPRYWAEKHRVPTADTLEETVRNALEMLGEGVLRRGGERFVPPFVWRTAHFQQWYAALKAAGNRLDFARVVWSWRVGEQREFAFFWILHVKIWIAAENRWKENEIVLARPDISTLVLYRPHPVPDETVVVLVREFRSPVSNPTGYVWENPGGSNWRQNQDPQSQAFDEGFEETSLRIEPERFRYLGVRQVAPTISTHKAYAYAAPITQKELEQLQCNIGVAFGVLQDTERTFVMLARLGDIRKQGLVGWGDLGMIHEALATPCEFHQQ